MNMAWILVSYHCSDKLLLSEGCSKPCFRSHHAEQHSLKTESSKQMCFHCTVLRQAAGSQTLA